MPPLTRRQLLAATAASSLISLLPSPALAQAPAIRPSFLILLADDLGYGDLACFGHPIIKTPHLDRLAAGGMRLADCYCSQPVCSPSRAGLLTGRIPHRAGLDDWIPGGSPIHLRKDEITLPQLLKAAGYATAHVGKWHCNGKFNNPEQPQPNDHGFDHWFSTQNNANPSHKDPRNFVRNGRRVGPLQGYSGEVIINEAISWLKTLQPDQPFCLFAWFHSTHEPIATAPEFTRPYAGVAKTQSQADYFGNVTQLDHEIGRLLASLDDLKRTDNTLTFFTSDNGPEGLKRYERADRSYGSAGHFRASKLHLYEGGIRVPGILRWPAKVKAGQTLSTPITSLDLLPTFCSLAAAALPRNRHLDGVDLSPLLSNQPLPRPQPLFWSYDKAVGGPTIALRDGDFKLLATPGFTRLELYNLKADPAESKDLAASDPARLAQLSERMRTLYRDVESQRPKWPTTQPATGNQK